MQQMVTQPAPLISDEYRRMQQELHENPDYGTVSLDFVPLVVQFVEKLGVSEILDYGAGKGRLGQGLRESIRRPLIIHHYDPAVPEWSALAAPSPFVACIDVLEHIEPHLLDNVLDDLQRVTGWAALFSVHTGEAVKVLPDGRNAHLIQQPPAWWLPKFMERFDLVTYNRMPMGFWIGVERKSR